MNWDREGSISESNPFYLCRSCSQNFPLDSLVFATSPSIEAIEACHINDVLQVQDLIACLGHASSNGALQKRRSHREPLAHFTCPCQTREGANAKAEVSQREVQASSWLWQQRTGWHELHTNFLRDI